MLSKKLTFSLTSLVMLLAVGFAVVPAALAAVDTVPKPLLNSIDESEAPGAQVTVFAALPAPLTDSAGNIDTQAKIDTLLGGASQNGDIEFFVRLEKGIASLTGTDESALVLGDFDIAFFGKDGIKVAHTLSTESSIVHRNTAFPDGRNFKVTIDNTDIPDTARYMTVELGAGKFTHAAPADVLQAQIDNKELKGNEKSGALRLILVNADGGNPDVVSIVRVVPTSEFTAAAVTGAFDVRITFTEEPKDFNLDKIGDRLEIENGKATAVVKGAPFYLKPAASEGNYSDTNPPASPPNPTGRDSRYHPYLVTVVPNVGGASFVEIRVKAFDDLVKPPYSFSPPSNHALAANRSLLRVAVSGATDIFSDVDPDATKTVKAETKLGNEAFVPDQLVIPANGYLILTLGEGTEHSIQVPANKVADRKTAASKIYNVSQKFAPPYPADDLENFFRVGGTVELFHRDIAGNTATNGDRDYNAADKTYAAGDVVISEIMWGSDAALGATDAKKSQWIELHNTTDADIDVDKYEWVLAFSNGAPTGTTATYGLTLIDTVSNASPYWVAPGSSGATAATFDRKVDVETQVAVGQELKKATVQQAVTDVLTPTSLTSMYRKIDGTNVMSGTSADSWMASTAAGSRNLSGLRAGTPGAATPYTMPPAPTPEPPKPTPKAPVATAADLMISEIMVASNDGRLPQWIEIANVGVAAVSLTGWSISIDNDPMDADVVAPSVNLKLGDVTIGKDQVALLVSKTGRNSGVDTAGAARAKGDANAGSLDADRIIDVQKDVSTVAQYSLISDMAFRISLIPPLPSGVVERGDVVGNLGMGWDIPMSEGSRSSLIRREMGTTAEIMGTDAAGWVLASDSSLVGAYVNTYYGDKDDMGTPGYDAGGALPVELSKFGAKRDPLTGQVIVTWETQSELNNAGFFIKRSQQKDSKFVAVNPTMIPGAGTTSEKQSYTYTDTTAQPNIVYYYQIEDVSLDGQRQTLTRGHRLKGHIGAAGKATTTWGELKEQQ